jgi:hypothetical protein
MPKAPFILPEHTAQMQNHNEARAEAETQQRMAAVQLINSIALDIYVKHLNLEMDDETLLDAAQRSKNAALQFAMASGMVTKRTAESELGENL